MTEWKEVKKHLLKEAAFAYEYEQLAPEYDLARSLIKRRLELGLTQRQVAERVGTTQSVISRLENMSVLPSLSFLKEVAGALECDLSVSLKPKEKPSEGRGRPADHDPSRQSVSEPQRAVPEQ